MKSGRRAWQPATTINVISTMVRNTIPNECVLLDQPVASRSTLHLVAIMAFWRAATKWRMETMPPERGHG
jgi:hypothetical protein